MRRKIIALIEVDDDTAFQKNDDGPISYLENDMGVRVEDLVLVTDHGHEILNHFSKELTVID